MIMQSAFFCCSLAQGTISAGICSLVRTLILLALGTWMLSKMDISTIEEYRRQSEPQSSYPELYDRDKDLLDKESNESLLFWSRVYGSGMLADGIMLLIVTSFLFIGIKRKSHNFILPWLVFEGVSVVASVVFFLQKFFKWGSMNIAMMLFLLLVVLFNIYLFSIVVSYFKTLKRGAQPTYIQHTPGMLPLFGQPEYMSHATLPDQLKYPAPPAYLENGASYPQDSGNVYPPRPHLTDSKPPPYDALI